MNSKLVNKVVNIDRTINNRRAINTTLNGLNKRKRITFAQLEEIGESLLDMGEQIIPIITRQFHEITDENILMRYLYLIEYLNFEEFVNPLIYAVLKRDLGDNFKASIINALYNFDVDFTSPVLSNIFHDAESKFYKFDSSFFDEIQNDEDMLINSLEWMLNLPYHKMMIIMNKLTEVDDPRKITLLEIIAYQKDVETSLRAVDILGTTRDPCAYQALQKIAVWHETGAVYERADRALKKLRLLKLDQLGDAGQRRESDYVCYSSTIDASGNYVLWMVTPHDLKPPLEVLCVLVNETEGIIDCFGSSTMPKKEFVSLIRKAKREDLFVRIEYAFCEKLLKDALFDSKRRGNSVPVEFLYREKMLLNELSPKEYSPDFSDYDMDKIKKNKRLLAKTASINEICGIDSWISLAGDMSTYAAIYLKLKEQFSAKELRAGSLKLVTSIFYEMVLPDIEQIKRRLFFAADVLRYNKKHKNHVKTILCAALNLDNIDDLPTKNPFLVNFILTNLQNAVDENGK